MQIKSKLLVGVSVYVYMCGPEIYSTVCAAQLQLDSLPALNRMYSMCDNEQKGINNKSF